MTKVVLKASYCMVIVVYGELEHRNACFLVPLIKTVVMACVIVCQCLALHLSLAEETKCNSNLLNLLRPYRSCTPLSET